MCLILVNVVVWGSEPTVWDGDLAFSEFTLLGKVMKYSSEPTVWDGDTYSSGEYAGSGRSSEPTKPTAWDGDLSRRCLTTREGRVLSPPRGMETKTSDIHP